MINTEIVKLSIEVAVPPCVNDQSELERVWKVGAGVGVHQCPLGFVV